MSEKVKKGGAMARLEQPTEPLQDTRSVNGLKRSAGSKGGIEILDDRVIKAIVA
jgi:hypothetical protein